MNTAIIDDHTLDEIVYLTSLASTRGETEEIQERLRLVTARMEGRDVYTLPAEDQKEVACIRRDIESYLLTRERLREFTPESLARHLKMRMAGRDATGFAARRLLVVLVVSVVLAAMMALLPGIPRDNGFNMQLASSVLLCSLWSGSTWLFLSALGEFTPMIRRAYWWLCAGSAVFATAQLLQPIIDWLRLREMPLVTSGMMILILFAMISLYVGARKYALQVGVQDRLVKVRLLLFLIGVAMVIGAVVPHAVSSQPEVAVRTQAINQAVICVLVASAAWLLFRVGEQLTPMYRTAVSKLAWALGVMTFVVFYVLGLLLVVGALGEGSGFAVAVVLFILNSVLVVRAGHAFSKLSAY